MSARANPFADLSDFEPKPTAKPVPVEAIEQIAHESGFPSRKAKSKAAPAPEPAMLAPIKPVRTARRYTTGRNRQINIKATPETIDRLYRLADDHNVPLGALLDLALDALEQNSR
ncbi:MAG: hypothetical protein SNJ73_00095 [Acetobacteraceae bacterium]